jgi:protocatechuate 3,4-dioxygenase beta subunit
MARVSGRMGLVVAVLLVAVGAGGLLIWKRGDGGGSAGGGDGKRAGPRSLLAGDLEVDHSRPAGTIEGTVLDAQGRPVDGAAVVLVRVPNRDNPFTSERGRPIQTVATAGGGRFRMQDVPPGSYGVSAMAPRHAPAHRGSLEVRSNETTTVELKLSGPGLVLRGKVMDVGGGVVAGARVRATEAVMSPEAAMAAPRVYVAVTGEDGGYELHLGRAQYSLRAEADGYAPAGDFLLLAADTTRDLRMSPAARISGRVIERGTRKPVADAELWLMMARTGGGFGRPRDVKSDGDGNFAFNDLEPGTYRVGGRQGRMVGMSGPVSLALAQAARDVEVEVHPGFAISGRTVDGAGKPVAGARLDLYKDQPPSERPMFTKSDGDGQFRFEGVLPAQFRLQARADGFAMARQQIKVAADVPKLDVKLTTETTISGRVTDEAGRPIEGALVNAQVRGLDRTNFAYERATSAADGSFTVKGLIAGELTLSANHREHGGVNLRDQKLGEAEKKVVVLKLEPGGTLSGTVKLDDGRPAAGARIEAQMRNGGGRWNEVAGPDGTYRLTGVPEGTVIVVAAVGPGMMWSSEDRPDQKSVAMAAREQKTGVDLVVPGAKTISGLVVDPGGQPVSGAEVTAGLEREGRAMRRGLNAGRAFTGPDGTFTLDRVGAGAHTVWAVHAGFADAEATGVQGGASNIKLQFPPEALLGGLVTTPDGKPVTNYTVTLGPAPKAGESLSERRQRQSTAAWDSASDVVHDPTGRFLLRPVNPGSYELRATTVNGNSATLAVTVAAGEKKEGLRVVLQLGGRVVGKVVDRENDQPLAGVEIRAFASNAMNRAPVRTDATGAFTLEDIPAGESVMVMIIGDRSTHLSERRQAEISKGATVADVGTVRLTRGNLEARMKEGTWEGMSGVNNSEDEKATVLQARPGSPAEKAGIKAGDAILSIDGKDVRGQGFGGVEWLLRGRPGSSISMTVQTPGQPPRTVTFNRTGGTQPAGGATASAAARPAAPAPAAPAPAAPGR